MLRRGIYAVARPIFAPAGGYEAESEALFARMTPAPDDTRKGHINALIAALKSAGIWAEIDAMYVLAAHDAQAAGLNWVSTNYGLTAVNSPTFEADRGYTGGGTGHLTTGFTPSTNGVNFTQDDASIWVWSRTSGAHGTTTNADVGNRSGSPSAAVGMRNSADNLSVRINDGTTLNVSNTDGTGLGGAQRRGAADKRGWRNGAEVSSASTASTGLPTQEQWICGANNTAAFSTRQVAFAMWASALTGLEAALYSAVGAYMTAVGA